MSTDRTSMRSCLAHISNWCKRSNITFSAFSAIKSAFQDSGVQERIAEPHAAVNKLIWSHSIAATILGMGLLNTSLDAQVPSQVYQAAYPSGMHESASYQDHGIQQTQAIFDSRRALDSRIRAMPKSERKLEVIHNRSQLVITDKRVTRIAFSDPNVLDVVQFSEQELSILGTGLGTTDLWLWFEEEGQTITEPLNLSSG